MSYITIRLLSLQKSLDCLFFTVIPILMVFIFEKLISLFSIGIVSAMTFAGDVGGNMVLIILLWLLFTTKRLKVTEILQV